MTPAAELDRVQAGYHGTPVLHDVSLAIPPGTLSAVIGPNGSGKSTLLKVLARFVRPSAGTVSVFGQNLWKNTASWSARQLVYSHGTEDAEWPMTVREAVILGRTPHRGWLLPFRGHDRNVVQSAMERTGVLELADRRLDELSDGERQRVILARALAQEPRLLLLDEPTANLDLHYQVQFWALVRSLSDGGLTVVAAVHDLTQTARWADRLILLSGGRVAAQGEPMDVLTPDILEPVYRTAVEIGTLPDSGLVVVPRGKR